MQRKTKLLIAGTSAVGLVALALGGFAVAHSRYSKQHRNGVDS